MKKNVNLLFEQLDNGFSKNATKFGISILFVASCSVISNYLVVIVINRFKLKKINKTNDYSKESKTTEEKQILNKSNKEKVQENPEENIAGLSQIEIDLPADFI